MKQQRSSGEYSERSNGLERASKTSKAFTTVPDPLLLAVNHVHLPYLARLSLSRSHFFSPPLAPLLAQVQLLHNHRCSITEQLYPQHQIA